MLMSIVVSDDLLLIDYETEDQVGSVNIDSVAIRTRFQAPISKMPLAGRVPTCFSVRLKASQLEST
jgi:hypothetical protein